jgi:hypothetical protein
MSYISAGTTNTTSLVQGGDTTGNLVIATGSANTAAVTISSTQNANFANRIGVGIATPDCELNILATPQTVSYAVTGNSTTLGTDLHISGADSSQTRITQDAFGANVYVAFTGRAARGTAATPTQTLSGDTIAQFTGRGFSNNSLQFGNASTGRLDVVAAENFTDTSRATNVQIFTTAANSITPTAIATFSSASGLSVAGNLSTSSKGIATGSLPAGCVIQVQQTALTTTTTLTANGTATNVAGLAVSITPTSATSKILITIQIMYSCSGTTYGGWVTRNGSAIGLGAAGSGQQQVSIGMALVTDNNQSNTFVYSYLDSPATTSAITYQFAVNNDNNVVLYVNRSVTDSAGATGKRGISTITVQEIAQ